MKSLQVLERLAKQAADRERQTLLRIAAEINAVEARILGIKQAIEQESNLPWDVMTTGSTFSAFVAGSKSRIDVLNEHLRQLNKAYNIQSERVRHERTEEKRYALIAERRAERAAAEAALKQQKAIDELVSTRHGRQTNRLR